MHWVLQAGAGEAGPDALQPTSEYMGHEEAEKARTAELWQRVVRYETMHPISLKACHSAFHATLASLILVSGQVQRTVFFASDSLCRSYPQQACQLSCSPFKGTTEK